MSLDSPSDVPSPSARASDRHVRFHHPIASHLRSGTSSIATELPTPLLAATTIASRYIATLHIGLTTFLSTLVDQSLKAYSVYFQSSSKNNEMRLNLTHVPTSIKKIRLTLQPLEEVKESEDFKALHSRLVVETEALQRKWADEYAIVVDTWNCQALLQRFYAQLCILLHRAAEGFIAQLGIKNYTASEAIIDFIGKKFHTALQSPLPLDLKHILQIYKDANHIPVLPKPTIVDDEIFLPIYTNTINLVNTTKQSNDIIILQNGVSPASSLTNNTTSSQPAPHAHRHTP